MLDCATIFALATPPGVGGIAVLRLSGSKADDALRAMTRAPLPALRVATVRRLVDEAGGILDEALVLRFAEGASFTGEPMVEIHCHGGRAVVAAVHARLSRITGLRPAEAGEFTRRALLNGRLDLAEVEALGDLLSAETERQRQFAALGVAGAVHRRAEAWRVALLDILAQVEITIDWADEDVPQELSPALDAALGRMVGELEAELSASVGLERLREGFEVAVVGAPNCGKSSFINHLAGREAAITSPHPGTTRDVIELRYDLRGLPVTFLDMAGLRATDDDVERIGVEKAMARAGAADLRLHFRTEDAMGDGAAARLWQEGDLTVWTKSDLATGPGDHCISTLDGEGVADLLTDVFERLSARVPADGVTSHARQRGSLTDCRDALCRAREGLSSAAAEIVAEDLRAALLSLGQLVGRSGVEEMLDRVFVSFCVGK